MRIQEQAVDGMTFRILSSGERGPAGSTFVLLHGIGTSHRYLAKLHARLAENAEVHSIDMPGFGGVPKAPFAPSVPTMAVAIGAVLDHLGVRDAVLVGHSMGTQWAVETALVRPDLARAVVIIGPVADDRRRSVVGQGLALARDVLGEPPNNNIVVLLDYLRCGPVWFMREIRHMLDYPIEDRVPLLGVPLLVVRGGNDPIAKLDWSRRLRDRAPRGRLIIVPGHRHNVQHSAPRAVASAITAFTASIPVRQ